MDYVVCGFKIIKQNKKYVLEVIKRWLRSNEEFVVRGALVILLTYYIEKDNLKMIFLLSESIKHKGYYVYMANSWLISVCMAKYPTQTIEFFKSNSLDKITHNSAIQKSLDSLRVSQEYKIVLKNLKR